MNRYKFLEDKKVSSARKYKILCDNPEIDGLWYNFCPTLKAIGMIDNGNMSMVTASEEYNLDFDELYQIYDYVLYLRKQGKKKK